MPRPSVLVDTGALVALVRKRDRYHERIKEFLGTYFGELVTTWPVLTEAAHLVPVHVGPRIIALSNHRGPPSGPTRNRTDHLFAASGAAAGLPMAETVGYHAATTRPNGSRS